MKTYKEKIMDEVETITDVNYVSEFVPIFKEIKSWAETMGLTNEVNYAQYEIELCQLTEMDLGSVKTKKSNLLVSPFCKDGVEYPSINNFTSEQFKYYEQRLQKTSNLFLRYRYSIFLFEHEEKVALNKYELSKYLLPVIKDLVDYYQNKSDEFQYVNMLFKFVKFSLTIADDGSIEEAIKLIKNISSKLYNEKVYYLMYLLSEVVREILNSKFREKVTDKEIKAFIKMLEDVKDDLLKEREYEGHRKICEELKHYERYLPIGKVEALQLEIGEGYKLELGTQQVHGEEKTLNKAYLLELAMKHYANIGETQEVGRLKVSTKENYKELERSDELMSLEVNGRIPCEQIKEKVNSFIGSDINTSLSKILDNSLIPDLERTKSLVTQLADKFPFQANVTKGLLNNGKKIAESTAEEELYEMQVDVYYTVYVENEIGKFLEQVFDKLISEQDFGSEDIMDIFKNWGFLDKNQYNIIEVGIKSFFEGDYVSSLHVLVPKFESTVRELFEKAKFPTTSMKKTSQHEQTFNAFLDREDVKLELNKLGKDFHKVIQIVMTSQTGMNLRNDIAHGLIPYSSVTKSRCIIVIYLFLILTKYTVDSEKINNLV